MRDFAKISISLWRSRKFRSLPDDRARMLYVYILTSPHSNSAGCYDLPVMYGCTDLAWETVDYLKALDSLAIAGLLECDSAENTIFISNWATFNAPTNPKHALGILTQLDQASSSRLKFKAYQEFAILFKEKRFDRDEALRKAMQSFFEAYGKPIATETETESKTEKERETKTEMEIETFESNDCAREAAAPDGAASLAGDEPMTSVHHLLQTGLMKRGAA